MRCIVFFQLNAITITATITLLLSGLWTELNYCPYSYNFNILSVSMPPNVVKESNVVLVSSQDCLHFSQPIMFMESQSCTCSLNLPDDCRLNRTIITNEEIFKCIVYAYVRIYDKRSQRFPCLRHNDLSFSQRCMHLWLKCALRRSCIN